MEFTDEELTEMMSSVIHEVTRVRAEMILLTQQWRKQMMDHRIDILTGLAQRFSNEMKRRKPAPPKAEPVQQEIIY